MMEILHLSFFHVLFLDLLGSSGVVTDCSQENTAHPLMVEENIPFVAITGSH